MSSLKEKAASGMLWSALNNAGMQVLNAVFGIVLARKLSQEDYGLIGMLTVFSLIAVSLQDSGFVTALTNRRDATHRDYNSVFWFNVSVSSCLYVLLFLCAPLLSSFYNEPLLTSLARYYFLSFVIASVNIVPRALLFRQIRQKELAFMSIAALLVSGMVGICMAYSGMAYWGLATQTITYNLMVTLISWWLSGWKPSLQITMQPVREMFGFSSKMLLTNIFNHINNNIFSLLLGKFYTKSEVGQYNQANKWNLMGASTITGMVQGVAQPVFVEVGTDRQRLANVFSSMLRFTCFISFPVMFGLSLIAPEFIVVLITEKWLPSASIMRMLCIGGAFVPVATLYFNLIISQGRSNIYMWNVVAQGVTLLSAILLIYLTDANLSFHIFGLSFAASGVRLMVTSYVLIIILWVAVWHFFLRRLIPLSYSQALRNSVPYCLMAATSMLATYFLTSSISSPYLLLAIRIPAAAVIYILLNVLFGREVLLECVKMIKKK